MNRIKLWPILGVFFLLWSLVACDGSQEVVETPTFVPVDSDASETAVVTPETPSTDERGLAILAEGVIKETQPALPLGFATGGRLLALHVQPGDAVQAGDLMATLDDGDLQDSLANAELQLAQAEVSLAQAQAELDRLLTWEPDETAVALAEANLAAAEAALEDAQLQDSAAGNSLTSARVSVDQAERSLADAQEAYDTAFDPGREWELNDPFRSDRLKNEREAATRNLEFAQENLAVAQANYNLAVAGLGGNSALNAEASVLNAQQALEQAQEGPTPTEIEAARLNVQQAEIASQQSELALTQAQENLEQAWLLAPSPGTILSVEAAPGALVGSGAPVVTLLDTTRLEFHTTNLSERDLAQIRPELPVQITLKSFPNDPITGTVARIGAQAEGIVGDAAVFPIIISLPQTDLDIRPGMTGRAEILSGE